MLRITCKSLAFALHPYGYSNKINSMVQILFAMFVVYRTAIHQEILGYRSYMQFSSYQFG